MKMAWWYVILIIVQPGIKSASAQVIGFTGMSHVALSNNIKSRSASWAVGAYYDQRLGGRWSFQTGIDFIQYDQLKIKKPLNGVSRYHNLVELPVYFSYDALSPTDPSRNLNFSIGCSFGKITLVKAADLQKGMEPGPYVSFAFGPSVEYQFPAGPANTGAVGFRTRYMTNLYHSRDFTDVGLFARFGFNLKRPPEEEWQN